MEVKGLAFLTVNKFRDAKLEKMKITIDFNGSLGQNITHKLSGECCWNFHRYLKTLFFQINAAKSVRDVCCKKGNILTYWPLEYLVKLSKFKVYLSWQISHSEHLQDVVDLYVVYWVAHVMPSVIIQPIFLHKRY